MKTFAPLGRKFSVDVLWNIASLAFLGIGGVCINLVIAHFRGAGALGVFNQVFAIYIILSQFAVGGLQFSILKHVSHHQDDPAECGRIASAALVLTAGLAATIAVAAFLAADLAGVFLESDGVAAGLRLAAPGLLFFAVNKGLFMVLNGVRHMRAFAMLRAARYALLLASLALIIASGAAEPYLALSLTVAEALLLILLAGYVNLRLFRFTIGRAVLAWLRPHVSYGLRGFMSGVLMVMNMRVGVLMLGYFLTDEKVGVYSFAAVLAEGLAQIPNVLRQNVDPLLGAHFAEQRKEQIAELARNVRRTAYLLMGLLGTGVLLVYPLLLRVSGRGSEFGRSWGVLAILLVGVVGNAGYRPIRGILLQGGRPGTHTTLVLVFVVANVVLNAVLIPLFGIFGAAVATASVFLAEAFAIAACARLLFGIRL